MADYALARSVTAVPARFAAPIAVRGNGNLKTLGDARLFGSAETWQSCGRSRHVRLAARFRGRAGELVAEDAGRSPVTTQDKSSPANVIRDTASMSVGMP